MMMSAKDDVEPSSESRVRILAEIGDRKIDDVLGWLMRLVELEREAGYEGIYEDTAILYEGAITDISGLVYFLGRNSHHHPAIRAWTWAKQDNMKVTLGLLVEAWMYVSKGCQNQERVVGIEAILDGLMVERRAMDGRWGLENIVEEEELLGMFDSWVIEVMTTHGSECCREMWEKLKRERHRYLDAEKNDRWELLAVGDKL